MTQYYLCIVLIIFLFFLLAHELVRDFRILANPYKRILLCLALTLLFKYNYGIHFYGLEYEDAFVFSFCARQFSYNIFSTSFLIDAVSAGSLAEPMLTSTYGGHFIMYPTYLSLFTNVLGWSPTIISIANTIISFFILLILSLLPQNDKYWFLPPILFCCSPIINIFTTCFLAEIFSSFICLIFIYTYFRKENIYSNTLCFSSFLIAIMCKRENLALLSIPVIELCYYMFYQIKFHRKNESFKLLKYIPFIVLTSAYFLFIQNVFNIEAIESNDIENPTFSIQYMCVLLPVFIKSLLNIKTFGIVFATCVLRLVYMFIHKKMSLRIVLSVILFLAYLVLYSSHYRGYFFIKEESVSSFETYRYINNFFYLLPIMFISFNFKHIKQVIISCCIVLAFSLCGTYSLRHTLSGIEHQERFDEVQKVSKYILANSPNSVLVCENILLYQNVCEADFKVCDITLYNKLNIDNNVDYYLLLSDVKYLEERYSLHIDLNDFHPVLNLQNGKYLYKYNHPANSEQFNNH